MSWNSPALRAAATCLMGCCLSTCVRSLPEDEAAADINQVADAPDTYTPFAFDIPTIDAGPADSGAQLDTAAAVDAVDANPAADVTDVGPAVEDVPEPPQICTPGEQHCDKLQLATCAPAGDGWSLSPCFAGQACLQEQCKPLRSNLIIVFDTSGSMANSVDGKTCSMQPFPSCDPAKGCSRMDKSKVAFADVLKKIPLATTNLALFRFAQRVGTLSATSCYTGHYIGIDTLTGDTANAQHVLADSAWYWDHIAQVLCVPYPDTAQQALLVQPEVLKWMDGAEELVKTPTACANASPSCQSDPKCGAGACCSGACWDHVDSPELRATGGTPIGKTLFYVAEYMRHRVVIDGKTCSTDEDCANPNYGCVGGVCVDPARHCRQNVVVLFTDGGELNDPTDFFGPLVSARRMAHGLACQSAADCAGGAACAAGRCLPADSTGHVCVTNGQPCVPGVQIPSDPGFCAQQDGGPTCLPDPATAITAAAIDAADNALRAPDGSPFSVRLHVVDISSANIQSAFLAHAGNGRLLTADAADPKQFLATLESALDFKDKSLCTAAK